MSGYGYVVRPVPGERELVEWCDLAPKFQRQHDWAEGPNLFVLYKGHAEALESFGRLSLRSPLRKHGWEGLAAWSYTNGLLIRMIDNSTCRLAYFYTRSEKPSDLLRRTYFVED